MASHVWSCIFLCSSCWLHWGLNITTPYFTLWTANVWSRCSPSVHRIYMNNHEYTSWSISCMVPRFKQENQCPYISSLDSFKNFFDKIADPAPLSHRASQVCHSVWLNTSCPNLWFASLGLPPEMIRACWSSLELLRKHLEKKIPRIPCLKN